MTLFGYIANDDLELTLTTLTLYKFLAILYNEFSVFYNFIPS